MCRAIEQSRQHFLDYLAELPKPIEEAVKCELRVLQESSVALHQSLAFLATHGFGPSTIKNIKRNFTRTTPMTSIQHEQAYGAIRGLAVGDALSTTSISFINVSCLLSYICTNPFSA